LQSESALLGKVAVVTGGSRGIGFAIAGRSGTDGRARCPSAGGIRRSSTNRLPVYVSEGIETLAIPADVTRGEQISTLIGKTEKEFGPIDILVNNAGVGLFGPFHEFNESDWNRVMDTNLKSVFLMCRAVCAGNDPQTNRPHHQTSSSLAGKKHLRQRRDLLRLEMGTHGADGKHGRGFAQVRNPRESAICPGSVATEFSGQSVKDPSKTLQPEDVAHAVAALVTPSRGKLHAATVHHPPTRKP